VTRYFYPLDDGAGRSARAAIRSRLATVAPQILEVAELLTTELVSNAFRHGEGEPRMVIDLSDERVRVEVMDASPKMSFRPLSPVADGLPGRGLVIVAALADDWGVEPRGVGKAVWFELAFEDRTRSLEG
jgi:anti-sigma regulatory factor (Ser/Thr protein kinase)